MESFALILAAGAGTRMKSTKPKVAHEMLGRPLVRWVIEAAREAGCDGVACVLGHGRETTEALVDDTDVVIQSEQLGTGHAVMCARDVLEGRTGSLVVLSGDSPLISSQTIRGLIDAREKTDAAVVVLTMCPPDPNGYGRIVRDDAGISAIVEQKDCTPGQLAIGECNSGIYCFDIQVLLEHLDALSTDNAQSEYYLTDVVSICRGEGLGVQAIIADDYTEALGINSRSQLATATKIMQSRINEAFMDDGVTMLDPDLVWIGPDVTIEADVELLPMTFLMGKTSIARGTVIGPNCRLTDCVVGEDCRIDETIAKKSAIDEGANCGPRAYIRPGTHICRNAKVGTHVEIKKSTIREGAKVPHLSYVGDADIGERSNLGAGTITCNYDGFHKYPTKVGADAFIGSDTMLVAPVTIGEGAIVGAGSTITRDVEKDALAIARGRQEVKEGWAVRFREKQEKKDS